MEGCPAESTWLDSLGFREKAGFEDLGLAAEMLHQGGMTAAKPTFPAPDHDHGRCTADALQHAERVCAKRAQKFTPVGR